MISKLRVAIVVCGFAAVSTSSVSGGVPPCIADVIQTGNIDAEDLAELLGHWGFHPGHPTDFDGNDTIDAYDLAYLLASWGLCPECDSAFDCDDGIPCTLDACVQEQCANTPFTPCCGNGVVEAGEQCDPPNGVTCNAGCQVSGDAPPNNNCSAAISITNGATPFSTLLATTDGPPTLPFCELGFQNDQVDLDIWYNYSATCNGELTLSTCGQADFDTRLAVYAGCGCPVNPASIVGCNDDADYPALCGDAPFFHSELVVAVSMGNCYKIRVGGYEGQSGTGTLCISCNNPCSHCGGDCCQAHGGLGCSDPDCCESVCSTDPFCCDTSWDSFCVLGAVANPQCDCAAVDCCVAHATAGCSDTQCEEDVCATDLFCCLGQWDQSCANAANSLCDVCQ